METAGGRDGVNGGLAGDRRSRGGAPGWRQGRCWRREHPGSDGAEAKVRGMVMVAQGSEDGGSVAFGVDSRPQAMKHE